MIKGHVLPDGSGCFVATIKTTKAKPVKRKTVARFALFTDGAEIRYGRKKRFSKLSPQAVAMFKTMLEHALS